MPDFAGIATPINGSLRKMNPPPSILIYLAYNTVKSSKAGEEWKTLHGLRLLSSKLSTLSNTQPTTNENLSLPTLGSI
jgi:hypothetical protein